MEKIYKKLIISFIILVLIKILLSYFIKFPTIFSDEYLYAKMARSFFYNQEFAVHGIPTTLYPPLYPLFLSIAYIFKDMNHVYFGFKIINSVIVSTIIFPIYFLAKEFLTSRQSLKISFLISLIASSFVTASYIMSENLFYPLIMFFAYFLYKSLIYGEKKSFILSGVFLGLCYLTKIFGLFLIPILVVSWLTKYPKKFSFKKVLLHYIPTLIIMLPWGLRNIYLNGFSISGILGSYSIAGETTSFNILLFIDWIILYSGYLILASGVLFFIYFIFSIKKDKKLNVLFFLTTFIALLIILPAAYHAITTEVSCEAPFEFLRGRPIGRYVDSVLPLIILIGFISLKKFDFVNHSKKIIIITSVTLAISIQLIIPPLFPLNNQSTTYIGILKTFLEFITKNEIGIFNLGIFILIAIILIASPTIFHLLKNKKWVTNLILIILILNTLFAYGITYWNSNNVWSQSDHMKMGLWINENEQGSKNLIFDSAFCGVLSKKQQEAICETYPDGSSVSLIGFWVNKGIKVGSLEDAQENDLFVTKEILKEKQLYKKNGKYLYKIDKPS